MSNRTGTVWNNKKRGRWEAQVTVAPPDPIAWDSEGRVTKWKHHRRTVTAPTKREVLERMRKIEQQDGHTLPDNLTVGQWLDHWMSEILPMADISGVTRRGYTQIARLYVRPNVGQHELTALKPEHVRQMMAKLAATGKSPNTIKQARSVLRRALTVAEREALVARNVAKLVDGVKVPRSAERALDPVQARALLDRVDDFEIGPLLGVLISTGIRKGEALGLAWPSLDLDSRPATMTIVQSLKRGERDVLYLDEPKTAGSRRTVHLPLVAVEILMKHRERQQQRRDASGTSWGDGWADAELVFTSSIGSPLGPNRCNRMVQAMTKEVLGEAWTPHEMRHTAASLMIAADVPLKTISDTLGHSSIRVTADTYGHLMSPARTEAADAMQQILGG